MQFAFDFLVTGKGLGEMKKLVLALIALMALFTLFRAVSVFADKKTNISTEQVQLEPASAIVRQNN